MGKNYIFLDTLKLCYPPPCSFAFSAHSSSGFSHYMLPEDMSYVGTIHSHPSGHTNPSVTNLNNFFLN